MPDLSPSQNPPAYTFGSLGFIGAVLALANDWPWYGALLLLVVAVGAGFVAQRFTDPKGDT